MTVQPDYGPIIGLVVLFALGIAVWIRETRKP